MFQKVTKDNSTVGRYDRKSAKFTDIKNLSVHLQTHAKLADNAREDGCFPTGYGNLTHGLYALARSLSL